MARTKSKTRRKKKGAGPSKRSKRARSTAGRSARAKRAPSRAKAKTKRGAGKRGGRKTARVGRGSARKQTRRATRSTATRRKRKVQPETEGQEVYGEGNYTASRNFRRAEEGFVRRHKRNIAKMGKEAETALEGPEGRELNEAEEEARSHAAGEEE
jgi:hypothetical protein